MGRFINADAYASTGQGVLGNNMFAYCNNNPIKYSDPYGYAIIEAILAVVIPICIDATIDGVISALVEYITGGNSRDVWKEFCNGFGTSTAIGVAGLMTPADEVDNCLKAYAICAGMKAYFDAVYDGASHEEGLFVALLTTLTNLPYTVVEDATARKVAELIFGVGSDAGTAVLTKYFTDTYSPQPAPTIGMVQPGSTPINNKMNGGSGSSAAMYSAFQY